MSDHKGKCKSTGIGGQSDDIKEAIRWESQKMGRPPSTRRRRRPFKSFMTESGVISIEVNE